MRNSHPARFYEMMVITAPETTPEEITATVDQIGEYIAAAGGSVLRANQDSPWGRRRLAYPIRHGGREVRDGYYTLFYLELDPDKVEDVEREMRLNDAIMRYLVLQLSSEPVFPPEPDPEASGESGEGESAGEVSATEQADTEAAAEEGAEVAASDQQVEGEAAAAGVDETAAEEAPGPEGDSEEEEG